jgi:hypothetical protein
VQLRNVEAAHKAEMSDASNTVQRTIIDVITAALLGAAAEPVSIDVNSFESSPMLTNAFAVETTELWKGARRLASVAADANAAATYASERAASIEAQLITARAEIASLQSQLENTADAAASAQEHCAALAGQLADVQAESARSEQALAAAEADVSAVRAEAVEAFQVRLLCVCVWGGGGACHGS